MNKNSYGITKMRIAINGLGRIGRSILKIIFEQKESNNIEVIAINEIFEKKAIAHLLKYDSIHGTCKSDITTYKDGIIFDKKKIICISEKKLEHLPWKSLDIDIVVECSGKFSKTRDASLHIKAGAKKVLISTSSDEAVDKTVIYGINECEISKSHQIISNASCTTNCLAFLIKPLQQHFKLEYGYVNTVHAYTSDQNLMDNYNGDLRRARSAHNSIIPTTTNSVKTISNIFPNLVGRIQGMATRVPISNVSFLDFIFFSKIPASAERINNIMESFSYESKYLNIVKYIDEPLVSSDFNHTKYSCIFDSTQTKVIGNLIKVSAWYDNEWGYSARMVDVLALL